MLGQGLQSGCAFHSLSLLIAQKRPPVERNRKASNLLFDLARSLVLSGALLVQAPPQVVSCVLVEVAKFGVRGPVPATVGWGAGGEGDGRIGFDSGSEGASGAARAAVSNRAMRSLMAPCKPSSPLAGRITRNFGTIPTRSIPFTSSPTKVMRATPSRMEISPTASAKSSLIRSLYVRKSSH